MTWRIAVAGAGTIGARVASELDGGRVPGCELVAVLDSSSSDAMTGEALRAADLLVEASTTAAARVLLPARSTPVCRSWSAPAACSPTARSSRTCGGGARSSAPMSWCRRDRRPRHPGRGVPGGGRGDGAAHHHQGSGSPRRTHRPARTRRGLPRLGAGGGLAFPRTSNSSVALALATAGLDAVEVVVVADPGATSTRHRIELWSSVGRYDFAIDNSVSPSSGGRTSEITAWSVVDLLEKLARCRGGARGRRSVVP